MSYQVLARKYRPSSFAEMVGQQHVLKALINALEADRLHHAYLFAGTRGVGKTTVGRILAKCLNCADGVTSTPCGVCSSCVEIGGGRSVDLIEVDAASQRGVDETQQLLENVQYMPSRDRFKVYLIDEVHMLTAHSFNALLKTLEEPPPHVKFLLATTEPKRLPVTVLSRCLQFNLKNMTTEEVVGHLGNVLEQEKIEHDERALWLLGRAADGSMRDALSLTDQAIAYSGEQVSLPDVQAMLGAFDHGEVEGLLIALIDNDADALLNRVAALSEFSPDYEALLDDLLRLLHRIAVGQYVPGSIDNSQGDGATITGFCERISPEDVQLYYQIGVMGQRDLPLAPDPRAGFEMVLLRMFAFAPTVEGANEIVGHAAKVPTPGASTPGASTPGASTPGASTPGASTPNASTRDASTPGAGASSRAAPPRQAADPPPAADPAEMGPAAKRAAQLAARGDLGEEHPKPESAASDDRSIAAATEPDVRLDVDRRKTNPGHQPQVSGQPGPAAPRRTVQTEQATSPSADHRQVPAADTMQTQPDDAIWDTPPAYPGSTVTKPTAGEAGQGADARPGVSDTPGTEPPNGSADRRDAARRDGQNTGSDAAEKPVPATGATRELAPPIEPSDPAIEQQWFEMARELDVAGVTQVLASHCYLVADEDGVVHLRIEREHATLWNRSHERRIAEALGQRLGGHCRIEISIGPVPGNTPAMLAARDRERAQARAVEVIEGNDNIRALLADFDGTLIRETIEPRAPD